MKKILLFILILFSPLTILAQKPDWFTKLEKLQEFPTTEKDVEKKFNSPKIIYSTSSAEITSGKSFTKVIKYKLPEGELSVFYSMGKCSEKNTEGYDLDNGVILTYYFHLNNLVPINFLKLSSKKFTVNKADDTEHWFFQDKKKGVTYTILGEKLQEINFSLPDNFYRSCNNTSKNPK